MLVLSHPEISVSLLSASSDGRWSHSNCLHQLSALNGPGVGRGGGLRGRDLTAHVTSASFSFPAVGRGKLQNVLAVVFSFTRAGSSRTQPALPPTVRYPDTCGQIIERDHKCNKMIPTTINSMARNRIPQSEKTRIAK